MTLAEAAQQAQELAERGDEQALATLRRQWDEEVEAAARSNDYRVRERQAGCSERGAGPT